MVRMAIDGLSAAPDQLVAELRAYIDSAVAAHGSTVAIKPDHRIKFHWPPHPVSYDFHVLASDWTGKAEFQAHGETFPVLVARTPHGVFGRAEDLWLEARGDSLDEMLWEIREAAEPLFRRQFTIAETLGQSGRFKGHIRDLKPIELVKLLYCHDRDVANDARIEIETHGRSHIFTPALLEVLADERHPYRRSAQWCVLDLFEDLPSYCLAPEEEDQAVAAMKNLLWRAEDDYARTTFKAGVVLGGHIPHKHGGPVLIECLDAPSKIGRRAAIHGLFHVVEWLPEMRDEVISHLRRLAETDKEPLLRDYAAGLAEDIEADRMDHVQEPVFPDEP